MVNKNTFSDSRSKSKIVRKVEQKVREVFVYY